MKGVKWTKVCKCTKKRHFLHILREMCNTSTKTQTTDGQWLLTEMLLKHLMRYIRPTCHQRCLGIRTQEKKKMIESRRENQNGWGILDYDAETGHSMFFTRLLVRFFLLCFCPHFVAVPSFCLVHVHSANVSFLFHLEYCTFIMWQRLDPCWISMTINQSTNQSTHIPSLCEAHKVWEVCENRAGYRGCKVHGMNGMWRTTHIKCTKLNEIRIESSLQMSTRVINFKVQCWSWLKSFLPHIFEE